MFRYDEEFQDDNSKHRDPSECRTLCHCMECLLMKLGLILWLLQRLRRVRHNGLECCQQPPYAFPALPLNLSSPRVSLSAPSFRENKEEGKDKKLVLSMGRGG